MKRASGRSRLPRPTAARGLGAPLGTYGVRPLRSRVTVIPAGCGCDAGSEAAEVAARALFCCRCKKGGTNEIHSYNMEEPPNGDLEQTCSTYCKLRKMIYHNHSSGAC